MGRSAEGELHDRVVQSVAVQETSFFRDVTTFRELADEVLPAAFERVGGTRPVRLWSAGCASGQETYSLAMVAHEVADCYRSATFSVLATDFSDAMVERTRAATYTQLEVNRGLPARELVCWLARRGTSWVVRPELAALVSAQQHNLATEPPPLPCADVVLLRNVLIYFDLPTRRRVLAAVADALAPGGHLVLGASEWTHDTFPGFVRGHEGRATWHRLKPAGRGDR
jgi:chemotaxis protein methyltransferase CheR